MRLTELVKSCPSTVDLFSCSILRRRSHLHERSEPQKHSKTVSVTYSLRCVIITCLHYCQTLSTCHAYSPADAQLAFKAFNDCILSGRKIFYLQTSLLKVTILPIYKTAGSQLSSRVSFAVLFTSDYTSCAHTVHHSVNFYMVGKMRE